MHDSDEEEEFTYHHKLRSRIPCYGFVNPQQIPAYLHQNPEEEEHVVTRQNQENQNNLCATAEEFCPPEREATVSERNVFETEERSEM